MGVDMEDNECIEVPTFDFCIKAGVGKWLEIELQGENEAGEIGPINLHGYTIVMQIKKSYESFYPSDELSTGNGRIEFADESNSRLIVYFPSAKTAHYPLDAVYDVKIQRPDGEWERILQGTITTDEEVTKID